MTFTGYLWRSAQRRYMRSSISAKSVASSPPPPRTDRHDRGTRVVLAVEERLHLELADHVFQRGELATGLVGGVLVVHLDRELDEHLEVVEALLDLRHALELGLPMAQAAGHLLSVLDVVPEVGGTGFFAEAIDVGFECVDVDHGLDIGEGRAQRLDVGGQIEFEHETASLSWRR